MPELANPPFRAGVFVSENPTAAGVVAVLKGDGTTAAVVNWNTATGDTTYHAPAGTNALGGTRRHLFDREVYVDSDGAGAYVNVRAWGSLTGVPTTVQGYGITNAIRSDQSGTITGTLTTSALVVTAAAGTSRTASYQTAGVVRWDAGAGPSAETGGNAGSNYLIRAYTDAGALIGTAVQVDRVTTGNMTVARHLGGSSDAAFDVGYSGARFRNGSFSGTFAVGGTLGVTGAVTLVSNMQVGSGGGGVNILLGASAPAADNSGRFEFRNTNAVRNWEIGSNNLVSGALTFTPSTANGGASYTTPVLTLAAGGATVAGTLGVTGAMTTSSVTSTFTAANFIMNRTDAGSILLFQKNGVNIAAIGSTATAGEVTFGDASALGRLTMNSAGTTLIGSFTVGGNVLTSSDNAYDMGGVSSGRFRDFNLARNAAIGGTLGVTGVAGLQGILQTGATLARFENTFASLPSGAAGVGIELGATGGIAVVSGFNRTTAAAAPVQISGSAITLAAAGGVTIPTGGLQVSAGTSTFAADVAITGTSQVSLTIQDTANGSNAQLIYDVKTAGGVAQKWYAGANVALSSSAYELYDFTGSKLALRVDPGTCLLTLPNGGQTINGNFLTGTDNAFDFGGASSGRFRDFNIARNGVVGGTLSVGDSVAVLVSQTSQYKVASYRNTNAGVGAGLYVQFGNDAFTQVGYLGTFSSNWTTAGVYVASRMVLESDVSVGIGLVATHANGTVSVWAGSSNNERLRVDNLGAAGDTSLMLWDVTGGALVRASRGAADSGGVGFRLLRIPN